MSLTRKQTILARRLRELSPGVIAVSGGLDSRFLAHIAHTLGLDFTAIHFTGPHLAPAEEEFARAWLDGQGTPWRLVAVDPLGHESVHFNHQDRCYHCKRAVFSTALEFAAGRPVLDGSQASDASAYRPGRKALAELGIVSPLAEAGLTKPDIRQLARATGLTDPEQPGRPCLLTRFAYGLEADPHTLLALALAEEALARLGLVEFRLRVTAPGRFTLQIALAEQAVWDEVRRPALALPELARFSPLEVLFTETVSGFFDAPRQGGGATPR